VREISPIGRLHVHVLADVDYVPQRVLSKLAADCGFGPVCDIRAVQGTRRVVRYLGKYLFKAAGAALPRYWRRVQSNCAMLARRVETTEWMFAATRRCDSFYKEFYGDGYLGSDSVGSDARRLAEGAGVCEQLRFGAVAPGWPVQRALFARG